MSVFPPDPGLTTTVARLRRLAAGSSDASGHFPARAEVRDPRRVTAALLGAR